MSITPNYRRLILAIAVTLTGCRFNGVFNYDDTFDAGPGGTFEPPDHDAGTPSGGHGGSIAGHSGHGGAGHGGMSGGGADDYPAGGIGGNTSIGGQSGESQGGSGSDQPVGGQGDDYDCSPGCAAGTTCCSGECVSLETDSNCGACGKDCSLRFSGDGTACSCAGDRNGWLDCRGSSLIVCTLGTGDPPVGGSNGGGGTGGDEPPVAGGGSDEDPSVATLELEVVVFSIKNERGGPALVLGGKAVGSVFYKNRNTTPVEVKQIVIAGRPPGGTHANGPYLDLIPPSGDTTIPPGEPGTGEPGVTYSAFRTMRDTDPLGRWEFYPSWQDTNAQWHDGESVYIEVVAPPPVDDQDGGV